MTALYNCAHREPQTRSETCPYCYGDALAEIERLKVELEKAKHVIEWRDEEISALKSRGAISNEWCVSLAYAFKAVGGRHSPIVPEVKAIQNCLEELLLDKLQEKAGAIESK